VNYNAKEPNAALPSRRALFDCLPDEGRPHSADFLALLAAERAIALMSLSRRRPREYYRS